MLDIARDRGKTLKKEKEKRKVRKNQTAVTNIFFTFNLLYTKIKFCQKTYLEKLSLCRFFTRQVIGNAVTEHQRPCGYATVL